MQDNKPSSSFTSARKYTRIGKHGVFRKLNSDGKIWLLAVVLDWILVASVFFFCYLHIAGASTYFGHYSVGIWIIASVVSGKLNYKNIPNIRTATLVLFLVNISIMVLIYWCSRFVGIKLYYLSWSWFLVFLFLTFVELIGFAIYFAFRSAENDVYEPRLSEKIDLNEEDVRNIVLDNKKTRLQKLFEVIKAFPIRDASWKEQHQGEYPQGIDVVYDDGKTIINAPNEGIYLNMCRLNDVRHINAYFRRLNVQTPKGNIFVFRVLVHSIRKDKYLSKFPFPLNHVLYFFDYLWNRVFSKLHLTRGFYFFITKGRHKTFPHAEILGRMYSAGLEILGEDLIDDELYIAMYKSREPYEHVPHHYGAIIHLPRVGKDGKIIHVYKFRTMSAYAEYLQPFMYEKYHLKSGGKIQNDFRINTLGRRFRRRWLDEIPMLINLLNGDLKLVGVRPLSQHYFSLYDKSLQELRIKTSPGLIPPFYADMPQTLEEIEESERKYLEAYLQNPHKTDWVYFWKIMKNIVIKHKHSA